VAQRCVERALAYGPLAALDDRPRPGKELTITPEAKAWLVSLACDKAKEHGCGRQLARSIEAFGFNVPVLIDANMNVIAGHGRVMACQELGRKEVPTICLDHLSSAQAKAFMIADNRLSENSIWDERLLAEQLKELSILDLEFSLEATGFEMAEIDLQIEGLTPESAESQHLADVLPEIAASTPITRAGDLWQLGRHRVLCGSAVDAPSCAALMDGEQAAMAFTDPPYNVPIDGHASGLGSVQHRDFAMASGEMDRAEFINFLRDAFGQLSRHSLDGSIHFICMDWRHLGELRAAGEQAYSELKNICVWVTRSVGGAQRGLVLRSGGGLQQPCDFFGAQDRRDFARLTHEGEVSRHLGSVEGYGEEEAQRRNRAVDARRTHAGLRLMQLKAAKVLRCRGIRRTSEEGCEGPDVPDIVVARLLDEVAHAHVFDHAPAQRADGLLTHRGAPVSRWRLLTP
jgi:hypothetical protein